MLPGRAMEEAMKQLLRAAALLALVSGPALAQPEAAPAGVCIDTLRIDHTSVPDKRTILFHMQGGKVWKNTLRQDCPGLRANGFSYAPTPPHQICSNLQTIRVIRTGSVCMLGAFTPYAPAADKAAP